MTTASVRAIVADDHPLFRIALKQAVGQVITAEIAESCSLQDTIALLAQHPDVELIFLDLNMPGNDGLVGLTTLRNAYPDVLVVIVSAEERPQLIHRAIALGASGYIPKSTPLPAIAAAVEQVLDGEQWVPADMDMTSVDDNEQQRADFARKLAQLTPHQFTVLKMMADGLLNKQIAYELGVKETTIKQHGSAILRKLNVINRTQAGVLFKQAMGADANEPS
ncbi:response regulator transcription factor [Aestuariibacter halophilus]|uniref:Response regulator transcription factor n=1 Tax=Fluctibacter halophilus TaxID=226011 RepID=A0ABS8G6D8_9ALTE|nr:response regulator transcription factor [Aestuariibacter halophilus]MCC2616054.1 response regulator transcription factor [Aestuariibacter halophilus]